MSVPRVVAKVSKVRHLHGDTWVLTVTCPFCGSIQQHSAGVVVRGHDAPLDEMYCEKEAICGQGRYLLTKEGEA